MSDAPDETPSDATADRNDSTERALQAWSERLPNRISSGPYPSREELYDRDVMRPGRWGDIDENVDAS